MKTPTKKQIKQFKKGVRMKPQFSSTSVKKLQDVYVHDFLSVQLFHIENLLKWIIVLLAFIALEMVFN